MQSNLLWGMGSTSLGLLNEFIAPVTKTELWLKGHIIYEKDSLVHRRTESLNCSLIRQICVTSYTRYSLQRSFISYWLNNQVVHALV